MSFNDYVKYMTEQFIQKLDEPKEQRITRKTLKKQVRMPLLYRAFGVIPLGVGMYLKHFKRKNDRKGLE